MGKRRVQTKVRRQQVRQVKPKLPAAPATPDQQKRQREKYVQAGGLLQGYAPEFVERIAYYSAGGAAVCIAIGLLLLFLLPYGWPVRIVAAIAWLVPVAFVASFVVPGFQLARKDRKQEARVVQGQLLGASAVSTSLGLGMLMVKTRGGTEQYLVAPEKLAKVPGNQVPVMVTVTPNLRHVRGLSVMGQRLVGRPEPPVPEVVKRLRLLPIVTPAALALAAIIGDDGVAAAPLRPDWLHALIAVVVGAALAGGVYAISFFLQRSMYAQVQALVPGGVG
jgi:putative flippase GtrA